jgi:hypothetical protein
MCSKSSYQSKPCIVRAPIRAVCTDPHRRTWPQGAPRNTVMWWRLPTIFQSADELLKQKLSKQYEQEGCSVYSSILKIVAICSSETSSFSGLHSVISQYPVDSILHNHRCKNLKFYKTRPDHSTWWKWSMLLGRGHIKEIGNRNFRELLSTWVEHMLLNGAAQIEQTATQLAERLRNSNSRQQSMPVFSQLRCRVFPSISCSVTRFSDAFVSKGWWSC